MQSASIYSNMKLSIIVLSFQYLEQESWWALILNFN